MAATLGVLCSADFYLTGGHMYHIIRRNPIQFSPTTRGSSNYEIVETLEEVADFMWGRDFEHWFIIKMDEKGTRLYRPEKVTGDLTIVKEQLAQL